MNPRRRTRLVRCTTIIVTAFGGASASERQQSPAEVLAHVRMSEHPPTSRPPGNELVAPRSKAEVAPLRASSSPIHSALSRDDVGALPSSALGVMEKWQRRALSSVPPLSPCVLSSNSHTPIFATVDSIHQSMLPMHRVAPASRKDLTRMVVTVSSIRSQEKTGDLIIFPQTASTLYGSSGTSSQTQDSDPLGSAISCASRSIKVLQQSSFLLVLALSLVNFSPAPLLTSTLGSFDKAVSMLSMIAASAAAAEIILSPVLGSVLDSVGRKPAMVAAQMVISLAHAVTLLHPTTWSVCVAKATVMLCSGQLVVISQSMIGDLTASDPRQIGPVMGVQTSIVSFGFLVGSILGGQLSKLGPLAAYGASAFFSSLGLVNTIFRMPETLSPGGKVPFDIGNIKRKVAVAPISWAKLLFRRGKATRLLSLLLMFQTMPANMGDVFQVYAAKEWNLAPQGFSTLFAIVGILGILANNISQYLIPQVGLKIFTSLAIVSSLGFPLGTFFSYKAALMGACLGGLASAQKIGVMAEMTTHGTKSGLPQGKLAGERASLLAILKVLGPIIYSFLYAQGREIGIRNLPFVFNIGLAIVALLLCQKCLP